MAKIVDPDDISYVVDTTAGGSDEMEIQTGAKTIKLLPQGTLSDDAPGATSGISGKCLYSKLKEIWKTDDNLNKHRFPIQMIYEASFQWINGWGPEGDQTRDLIRDAGFSEVDGRENACIISLGAMDDPDNDLAYYGQTAGFDQTTSVFDKTGELNENIQIKGTGGSPDNTGYLKVFLREMQKTYASYNLIAEQGLALLKYEAYRLPLANAADLNAVDNDTVIGVTDAGSISGVKYSELTIDYIVGQLFAAAAVTSYVLNDVVQDGAGRWARCTGPGTITGGEGGSWASFTGTATWEAYPGERQIGTNYYAFNRVLDVLDTTNGFKARLKEIHSWAQYKLRQSSDINDDVGGDAYGTVYGNVALPFTYFVGSTLHTQPGVFIDNFDLNDKNDMVFWDITIDPGDQTGGLDSEDKPKLSTNRTFPFTAAGTLVFSQNFVAQPDAETRYTMYFQYITTTSVSLAITSASGANCTLDWSSDAGKLDHLQSGDYVRISGFVSQGDNNGLYEITGSPSSNTVTATKADGVDPVNQAAEACTVLENPFESPGAVIVDDNSAVDIDGEISSASIGFDFDYTNNTQGGRTPDSDAPVYVVAIAYDGAQYVLATHTITKTTGQNVPINGVDELNYENPA